MQNAKTKRVYIKWYEWEDFQNGMWRTVGEVEENDFLIKAIDFTGDHVRYGNAMKQVVNLWPKTMLHNLTNPSMNKRAFLGHCACCWYFNCPEYITRRAWKELTEEQRFLADKVAQETINKWNDRQN